jgi:hypothetical protein
MLLYLIIGIVLFSLLFYNEGFKQKRNTSCEARHKAISDYPSSLSENNQHIDLLFNAKFKPECCPSPYSNSSGCLCRDLNHSELIVMRGGNRIMC